MTTGAPPPSRNAPRSRLRTFLPLALVAWLILEVWLLTLVAEATSGFIVFLLLLAGVVAGSALIKRAGRRA
ncbi:MAG: FxsA family protein, partial [Streptomyces albidoflavus]